jgi:SAM-dependent methyltransferase
MLAADPFVRAEFAPTQEQMEQLQKEFGLSYHVGYCATAAQRAGFVGKRVIEVGGSLPSAFVRDHLGVAQWTAVEELCYWREVDKVEHLADSPLQKASRKLTAATPADLNADYVLLDGAIEDAPEALAGQFDLAFSIACFEHVSRLPKALERIARLLKPGGRLFTMFSPLWSSHDGHHLPEITDASGVKHAFWKSPIPPWGHLLAGPSDMYQFLLGKTDPKAAEEMVYYMYHAPHINRLFTEDYIRYFNLSPLKIVECHATFQRQIPPAMQSELERMHPGKKLFSNNGILAVLERPH